MDVNSKRDDLTVIKGIGEAYQQWLREALDINTFDDLAALSVDELESHARAAGRSISRDDLEAWISQARELAGPATPPAEDAEAPEGESQINSPADEGVWKPTASFVVEFQARETAGDGETEHQTVVHHVEADIDAEWPGIESVELCRWMLEQLGEPALDLAEEARRRAQEQLDQELEEMRAAARQQLDQELEEERSAMRQEMEEERAAMRQEMEEERKEVRLRSQQALQQGLAEQKTRAQQALEEELAQSRAEAEEALERELQEVRARAEETLQRELEDERARAEETLQRELEDERARAEETLQRELERERARAQEELAESLEQQRLEAKAELELELEEYQREAKRTLDRRLEQARAEAEEALKRELAEARSQALQELEQELAELRAQAQRELEEELPEVPAEVRREREPAPEEIEEPRPVEREEVAAALEAPPYVKITALRAVQSSHTYNLLNGAEPETASFLEHDQPFTLEGSFELDRDEVAVLARQGATYVLQSYARDVSSGTTAELGATPQTAIVAGKAAYTAQLPNVTLSSGHYEFVVVVTVQSSPPNFDYRELPALAVA